MYADNQCMADKHFIVVAWEDPPPCNSGIIGIYEDPNMILIIPYSHYYRVGGPPKLSASAIDVGWPTQHHPEEVWDAYKP